MKTSIAQLNLVLAWLWILLGFVTGMVLGMFFHRESWLGGYASHKRRMYRLAHISFFGLGAVNLLFCLTARTLLSTGAMLQAASQALVVGAVTMPVCCVVMAQYRRAYFIFAVPVVSLILGGAMTLAMVIREPEVSDQANTTSASVNHQISTTN